MLQVCWVGTLKFSGVRKYDGDGRLAADKHARNAWYVTTTLSFILTHVTLPTSLLPKMNLDTTQILTCITECIDVAIA